MKRSIILLWLFAMFFMVMPGTARVEKSGDGQVPAPAGKQEIENYFGWQDFFQTVSVDHPFFYGNSGDGGSGRSATGFHIRPAWQYGRFEGRFDLAFYQNPWDDHQWQWGIPLPDKKPDVPNFIDSLAFHGDWLELRYRKITDLTYGYGLLMNDYHPSNPYRGWLARVTPGDTTAVNYAAMQDVIYLAPFTRNEYASLQVLRLDQSLNTGGLHWQLGFTGVHDSYPGINGSQFPAGGSSFDLTLTNVLWASPFWERADLEGLGEADMLGFMGRLGLFGYQAGAFRTRGKFNANYFGGRYEDLKWNSRTGWAEQGLTAIHDDSGHDGTIGRFWIEVNPWLKLGYLNVTDRENITGYSLSGNIERLGVEYGFFYYNPLREVSNCDWFIRGGNGFWGWEYHYYSDWDGNYRDEVEVSYKF